ncbi:MAG: OmpA family protein [Paucibacter sp.]|nr:OmpA family protein [Roseateles sp.]
MIGRLLLLLSILLLAGCAAPQRVILLPAPDGKVGAVDVTSAAGKQRVDSAYGGVNVSQQGQISSFATDSAGVEREYGPLLAARPRRPVSFVVYFQSGSSSELTPESTAVVQSVLAELEQRAAPELIVTGHTDAVGTDEFNDRLALERAQTVVEFLRHNGINAKQIEAVGRGKREPAVRTADRVAEQANRRVEITIR